MAEPAAAPRPWHDLEPTDYGADPRAVPVASPYPRVHGPPGNGERFWQMAPPEPDAQRAPRHYAPMPPQPRFIRRANGERVEGSVSGDGSVDGSSLDDEWEEEQDAAPGQAAQPRRRRAPKAGPEESRWYNLQPQQLPEGYVKPSPPEPGPVTLLDEDGHWYRMKPKAVPDDAPRIRAPSPGTLARLNAPRDHRGRSIAPGAPTPWPEVADKWHTLDRHQVVRQQEAWEVPPERGQYGEWEACRAEDCVVPRYYDQVDRWYEMPPVDDGTKAKRAPEEFEEFVPPEVAKAKAEALPPPTVCATAPYEDSSKWYKIPGHGEVAKVDSWRYC